MAEFKNAVNEFIRIFLRSSPTITGSTLGSPVNIGTAAASLIAFHGAAAVDQAAAIADASGGATVDAEARTALNALLAAMREKGLIAT